MNGSGYLLNLHWLMRKLGSQNITSLLVEGGGETNASFLFKGLAQRVMFFYAPKIMGGRDSRKGVAGEGVTRMSDAIQLRNVEWKKFGGDLIMTARIDRTALGTDSSDM
jgi:diaminohydroxyphosphoribosylaminopyrimidine deaminase/5-amino-6-(5-phosphoribosylamino)uracil reductase